MEKRIFGALFNEPPMDTSVRQSQNVWHANLELGFSKIGQQRTILSHRKHSGPLMVQKALWPEATGVCHVIMVHPPAGFAGGDEIGIQVNVATNSHALITTPGAGKWYASNGKTAKQVIDLTVDDHAILEWLPQETMLFNQAIAQSQTTIRLAGSAAFIGWDILVIGRQTRAERFETGQYQNQLAIWHDAQLIFKDQLYFVGNDRWLLSPLGMNRRVVSGSFYAIPPAQQRSEQQLDALIDILRELMVRMKVPIGLTRLGYTLVARYLGDDTRHCLDAFAAIRAKCRLEWFELAEELPRIWKT